MPRARRGALTWLIGSLLLVGFLGPASAHARWAPPQELAPKTAPAAAAALENGDIAVWALPPGKAAQRLLWAAGSKRPLSTRLDLSSWGRPSEEGAWDTNARGDVLIDGLVIEASGERAAPETPVPPDHLRESLDGALGSDGTAVVAWSAKNEESDDSVPGVWWRVRPPGEPYGPVMALPTRGDVSQVAVDIGSSGQIEILYAYWNPRTDRHVIVHTDVNPDATPAESVEVGSTPAAEELEMEMVAGGPDISRIAFEGSDARRGGPPIVTARRTGRTTWSPPRTFAPGSGFLFTLAGVDDGTAILAYPQGQEMVVRRAAPGAEFRAPVRAGRIHRSWWALDPAAASSSRGDLLLAWPEWTRNDEPCGNATCFARVVAATARAGGTFAPARVLSPLGSVIDSWPVAALTDRGRRLVAWKTETEDVSGRQALWSVLGDSRPDARPRTDRRAPRARIGVSRRALHAASRSGRLHLKVSCNEACAVRLGIWGTDDEGDPESIESLRTVVLRRAGTATRELSLSRSDRRILRRGLRSGASAVTAMAADHAGNVRATPVRPR